MDKTSDIPQNKPLETSSPEPEIPAKPSSKLPFIVGGIILLLIGVAGGWYYGQNAMKADTVMPSPSPVQETTGKVGLIEKSMDLYDITLQIPADWSFSEVNRRPEPTPFVEGWQTMGHDCAEYEIQNGDKTLMLYIEPKCGYSDGAGAPMPTPYTTVKQYSNGDFIARIKENNEYAYVDAGPVEITDETGRVRKEIYYGAVVGIGETEDQTDNLTFLNISVKYTGPESEKESQLSLADQVVASIETTQIDSTSQDTNSNNDSQVRFENTAFEFQYPSSWYSIIDENDDTSIRLYDYKSEDNNSYGPNNVVAIYTVDSLNRITFSDPVGTKVETGDKLFSTKLENKDVAGKIGMQIKNEVGEGSATDSSPGISTIIPYKDKYLYITLFYNSEKSTKTELDNVYKTILDTFTLVN